MELTHAPTFPATAHPGPRGLGKNADGSLTEVGSSGNLVGDKEKVEIPNAEAGTYVIRVINVASACPTYKLSCEKDGKVLQTRQVFIDRGEVKKIGLRECRRKG